MSAVAQPASLMEMMSQLGTQMAKVRIISIYPKEFRKEMQVERGFKTYTLPAAKRGGWSFCDVEPVLIWQPDRSEQSLEDNKGRSAMMQVPEAAQARASALVEYWASGMALSGAAGGGRPGIRVLPAGETEPSQAFLDQLTVEQTLWAEAYTNNGNKLHFEKKSSYITDTHRKLAIWLYGEDEASGLEWIARKSFQGTKQCPNCQEKINLMAVGCQHCGCSLAKFFKDNLIDPMTDPGLVKLASMKTMPAPIPLTKSEARLKAEMEMRARIQAQGGQRKKPVYANPKNAAEEQANAEAEAAEIDAALTDEGETEGQS